MCVSHSLFIYPPSNHSLGLRVVIYSSSLGQLLFSEQQLKEKEDFLLLFLVFFFFLLLLRLSLRNDERHNIVCAMKEEEEEEKNCHYIYIITVGLKKMRFKSSGIGSVPKMIVVVIV